MQVTRRWIRLSAIQVRWSEADAAFVACSAQLPGLTFADSCSSLAAVDGLLELIERSCATGGSPGPVRALLSG
jgi:hypothetical protein